MKMKILSILLILFVCFGAAYAGDSSIMLEQAKLLESMGYPENAIAVYNQILNNNPNDIRALLQFSDLMIAIKNYSYATVLLNKYLVIKPDDIGVRMLLVDIYNSFEMSANAVKTCIDFLKKHPDNKEILNKLLLTYKLYNIYKEESLVLEKISSLNPEDSELKKRLLELYMANDDFKKAVFLAEKNPDIIKKYSSFLMPYLYVNSDNYDRGIELYSQMLGENIKDGRFYLSDAVLDKIDYELSENARSYFYCRTMKDLLKIDPTDLKSKELNAFNSKRVAGLYSELKYDGGSTAGNIYQSKFLRVFYPALNIKTEYYASNYQYYISNENNAGIFSQSNFEINQALNKYIGLDAGIGSGNFGKTYLCQLYYQNNYMQLALKNSKNFQIQTPEAVLNFVSYRGTTFYFNWLASKKFNIAGYVGKYYFSDTNTASYKQGGGYYRIWDNDKNSWAELGLSWANEKYKFDTPLYYSPPDLNQVNYSLEWDWYFTKDSLLTLSYINANDNTSSTYSIYSAYADHKFSDNLYVYSEYLNGISRTGSIGVLEAPGVNDYEFNVGIKYKF